MSFLRTPAKYFLPALLSLLSFGSFAQCQFSVTHTATTDHCIYASEEVVWNKSSRVNVLINTNTITKTAGGNGASDAGAVSVNTVKNNGWATTVIAELNS